MAASSLGFDPRHWRARADEARANAARVDDLDSRRLMLEVATTYDRLAETAEKRAAANRGPGAVAPRDLTKGPLTDTPTEP